MLFGKLRNSRNGKKIVSVMLLAMAMALTGCGGSSGADATEQTSSEESNAEEETISGMVSAISDDTVTLMSFGNRGQGEGRPEGTFDPDMKKSDGEGRPEGTFDPDMKKSDEKGRPDGTFDPNSTMNPERQEERKGEEITILLSDNTTVTKENEDGTTETATVSDIIEGVMLDVTGITTDDGFSATSIVISNRQSMRDQNQKENNEA